jgi:hypothetical protein
LLEKFVSAALSFGVALAGVAVAYLWLAHHPYYSVLPLVALILIGFLCDQYGKSLLPAKPVEAVKWMEAWILVPGAGAALAAGLLIVIGVLFEPAENASVQDKKLLAATSGALATLITTLFMKSAEDADTNLVAGHISKAFLQHYARHDPGQVHQAGVYYFTAASEGELWVYGDPHGGISGWNWDARRKRAQGVAERINTSDRIP